MNYNNSLNFNNNWIIDWAGCIRSSKELASAGASLENLKSISQRRLELTQAIAISVKTGDESETSSQHSTSTINTVVELHPSPVQRRNYIQQHPAASETTDVLDASATGPLPRGWVKHIIGKLQGDAKWIEINWNRSIELIRLIHERPNRFCQSVRTGSFQLSITFQNRTFIER